MTAASHGRSAAGYTIVEVLVAAAILVVGVAAAASLALSMVAQEEANARVVRAINLQEQGARLYQLGLDPADISDILPTDPAVTSLTFTTATLAVPNAGTVETADCKLIFSAGEPLSDPSAAENRTNDLTVVRPSIR